MAVAPMLTKDMWVANLVDSWKDESNSIPVLEFLESINKAGEMGRLSSKDKVQLARLKLRGAARTFFTSQPQLMADDVCYEEFRAAFVQRIEDKHTDRFCYARALTASQEEN
jgi:hypothetical protein